MLRVPALVRSIHRGSPCASCFIRAMSSSSETAPDTKQKDWSASQYLKFNTPRTRPVHDLIAQIKPHISSNAPVIYDLGCGPGNSTAVLRSAFERASITGVDSSPDMLKKARADMPDTEFVQGDVTTFTPSTQPDLLFSNAVFHWLRADTRIPTLVRLFQTLAPGGVLAIQVPDNYMEPSHVAMRTAAGMHSQPWSPYLLPFFQEREKGSLWKDRPQLDPIESKRAYYDALVPIAGEVNMWKTTYSHILNDAKAIVEWVKGTGLQPFLNLIKDEEAKVAYLLKYEELLTKSYPTLTDGKVMLDYPRFFIVAVKGI
ncbi:hypothetical protein HBI54_040870 [Parastagonospora nodorum]|nr:hypothetical protein HBI78_150850 [Parastagonospora nodorum]KAH6051902.1 hypothetical protein HBI54_040870 [Parastagonospora nodorum]